MTPELGYNWLLKSSSKSTFWVFPVSVQAASPWICAFCHTVLFKGIKSLLAKSENGFLSEKMVGLYLKTTDYQSTTHQLSFNNSKKYQHSFPRIFCSKLVEWVIKWLFRFGKYWVEQIWVLSRGFLEASLSFSEEVVCSV